MNFEDIKKVLFDAARRAGLTDYDVYCAFSDDEGADALSGEMNSCSSGAAGGVSFRCAVNGRIGSVATQSMEKEELEALVARAVANADVIDADEEPIFFAGAAPEAYRTVTVTPPALPGVAALRRVTMELQKQLYAESPMMTDGTTSSAGAIRAFVGLANSKGVSLTRECGAVYTYVEPIINDGKEPSFGSAHAATLDTGTNIVKQATAEALARLGAGNCKTGTYDVIFDARQVRALLAAFAGIVTATGASQVVPSVPALPEIA